MINNEAKQEREERVCHLKYETHNRSNKFPNTDARQMQVIDNHMNFEGNFQDH